jgi:threonine dehydrogenase-like Zn-dependent dehydrogenase
MMRPDAMQALYWNGQQLRLESDYPIPESDHSTALVRIRLAGICSTDIQIFQGYMGFQGIPGHEFVGEVCAGAPAWVGQRVVGEINFACGRCPLCARGLGRHCPERRVMGILRANGSFAEYVTIPTVNLHRVPDSVPDEAAVFTEPLAAAFEILEQAHVQPTDAVLIFGDGKLGILCAQVLQTTGAQVHVVGKHPHKLHFLRTRGVSTTLLTDWHPTPADVVVEATGSTTGLALAIAAVRPRGTLVLKSTVAAVHALSLAPLVIHEVTVIGSRCGPFAPALRALERQQVAVTPLIERIYPLGAGMEAIAHATRSGTQKILLDAY